MSDESLMQHTVRVTKNAFTGCFGFVKKSDELAKIKYKETQIAARKKQFGVEYLDLVSAGAEPAELEACTKKAQDDMKKIKDEIAELEKEVERVDEETKKKIVTKPGGASATETKEEAKEEVKEEAKTNTPAASTPAPAIEPAAAPAPATETPSAPSAPAAETPSAQ